MSNRINNISFTLKHDLCTGCGICEGGCPFGAITTQVLNGNFRPVINSEKCTQCGRCLKTCPGVGINLDEEGGKLFSSIGSLSDRIIGRYTSCFTGYSNDKDLRYHAASGGMLSQFLVWLLENNKIDGAVVTKFDKGAPLKVKTFIARTREEILSAKSSKYAPVSHHNTAQLIKEAEGSRYVIVGLPCHIEGFRKLMSIDKKLRERVVGLFSLYCSGTRTFGFTEYVMKERGINLEKVVYLAYRDNGCLGGLVVKGEGIDYYEDYQSYCHPLRSIFYPKRCVLCADHFGELADICFGDIHVPPYSEDKVGINSLVVRSTEWQKLLLDAKQAGVLTLNELQSEILLQSQRMARVKKGRNVRFGMIRKQFGGQAPDYSTNYGNKIGIRDYLDYFQMSFLQFIGRHKSLWCLIPFLKAKVNIH